MDTETIKTQSDDGVESLVSDLTDNQPDVQQHVIDAEKQKQENAQNEFSNLEDRFGNRGFDPTNHVTGPDGKPSLTKNSKLRNRPGRKSSQSIVGSIDNNKQGKQDSGQGDPRQAAVHTVNMIEAIGTTIAGDEWKFIADEKLGIDERTNGFDAFEQYYRAKNIGDFPPGIALAIWALGYAVPRFTMPKTKSRLSKFGTWIKIKILSRRAKSQPEDIE